MPNSKSGIGRQNYSVAPDSELGARRKGFNSRNRQVTFLSPVLAPNLKPPKPPVGAAGAKGSSLGGDLTSSGLAPGLTV